MDDIVRSFQNADRQMIFQMKTKISLILLVLLCAVYTYAANHVALNVWTSKINPQTLEFYKAIGTIVVAIVAAAITSVIQIRQMKTAHRQWKTAQQKNNVELFNRRFDVFKAAMELPFDIDQHGDVKKARFTYAKAISQSEWLFNKEVAIYLTITYPEEAVEYTKELFALRQSYHAGADLLHERRMKKYMAWHAKELDVMKDKLRPFLTLEN